jgi:cold-inducible RNA-binding protein
MVLDRETGRSRGMAFVEMPNEEEALAAATSLNGKEIGGRVVTVSEARPEVDRRGHPNR